MRAALFLAGRAEVAVDAVLGDVQLAADKPPRVGGLPVQYPLKRFAPEQVLLRLPAPKIFRGGDRFAVETIVLAALGKIGLSLEAGGRVELAPRFLEGDEFSGGGHEAKG